MKLTKIQLESLMAKIKKAAAEEVEKHNQVWNETYIPSEEYKELKKNIIAYNKSALKLQNHLTGWRAPIQISLETELNAVRFKEYTKTDHFKNTPKFDFEDLQHDLVLADLEGVPVDKIVAHALITYRK